MKKLLIYGISLIIIACVLVLIYKHMQSKLNPEKPALPASKLENCQNLKINDPKLIAYANKCLIEKGLNINNYKLSEIKKITETERKRAAEKLGDEGFLELPDVWLFFYNDKRRGFGDCTVSINWDTCECNVHVR